MTLVPDSCRMVRHSADMDQVAFRRQLDALVAEGNLAEAEPFLTDALARSASDPAAQLMIRNELMGLYRSISRHADAVAQAESALALARDMGITATDAWVTTLINAATALRAAGQHERALDHYRSAYDAAQTLMAPTDRRLAALHNNLSIAYSDLGESERARTELEKALDILRAATTDPDGDLEIATTLTNLALVVFTLGDTDQAAAYAESSMRIFAAGGNEENPHYASALAGHAEASYRLGRYRDAVDLYRRALELIEQFYGRDSDYYRLTDENLGQALAQMQATGQQDSPGGDANNGVLGASNSEHGTVTPPDSPPADGRAAGGETSSVPANRADGVTGMELARAYWHEYGPSLLEPFGALRGRVAAGLVGHGSDCYGFDDGLSRDHDFGPGFCLWLTSEDYEKFGQALQASYDELPTTFRGVGPRTVSPRAGGAAQRVGVFEIGAFYEGLTGYRQAPDATSGHQWLMLEEATLAAATNGRIFADPLGAFSRIRGDFKRMPKDVKLALISRRLGMMAQAGQYNLPRMWQRGDGAAAFLAVNEFVRATASLVYLLNNPPTVGYLPYYKWQFAALRALSNRMASRLPQVVNELSDILRLSSAACFAGEGFAEGGKGSQAAREQITHHVNTVADQVVTELRVRQLSRSTATFLEWQRPYVEEGIQVEWLKSL